MKIYSCRFTTLSAIICALLLSRCGENQFEHRAPRAVKGVLDLSDWHFENDGPVDLSGEYEFYWRQHLNPEDFEANPPEASGFIEVPDSWIGYELNGKKLPGTGYATYRLTILFADSLSQELAFKFLDMGTAYRVFANGKNILSVGTPGVTKATTVPRYLPQVVDFQADSDRIDLLYQVSNFHHKRGGAWEVIRLGTKGQLYQARETRLGFDLILFGSILIMGLYHIALFAIRKKDLSLLFFGIFCLLIAARLLTTVERYLLHLFPHISWDLFVKIEYLSYYFGVPVFAVFIYLLFPQDFHKRVIIGIVSITAFFSAIVVVTPPIHFSYTLLSYNYFTALCILYGISMLVVAAFRKREGAWIILIGFVLLSAAVVNDILDAEGIIQTGHFVQLGLFCFIFSQAFLLSLRYSKAFTTVELQREELAKTNISYRNEIEGRKRAEKEKQELQERLNRSQKMEAIGLLAGGVAHDLNNILSGILTYPDLLLTELSDKSPLRKPMEIIRDCGFKAAAVVQDLLTLSRRGAMDFEVLNLNDIVSNYMASHEFKRLNLDHPGIDIETSLDPDLLNISGSRFHLKKSIMNLVTNAVDAQPSGGLITVSTMNRYVDKPINGYEGIDEGNYAVLKVEDEGTGMDEEDLKRIFEPFYTKKVLGRSGSGLGLAVVWGTVHDHDGYVDLRSRKGKGTVFELYFQVTDEEYIKKQSNIPVEQYQGANESILVVDDVKEQRDIAVSLLQKLGYRVKAVASGEQAIEYLKTHSADLLLLDMIMDPGMDGLETYARILQIHPGMKAIIASGYSETERVKQALKLGAGSYLKKPYTLEKIGLAIRRELDK